jgi:hypothetical protein
MLPSPSLPQTVKVGATVVETAVDVTATGVKAAVGSDDQNEKE